MPRHLRQYSSQVDDTRLFPVCMRRPGMAPQSEVTVPRVVAAGIGTDTCVVERKRDCR
jgi:hypothetical protein